MRGFTSFVRARLAAGAMTIVWREHVVGTTGNHLRSGWSLVATTHLYDVWRTSHGRRGVLRRQGKLGLEQCRLVLRHGYLHSHALHHIDSRHVSTLIGFPHCRSETYSLMSFRFCMQPRGICSRPCANGSRRQVQSYLFQSSCHANFRTSWCMRAQRELPALYGPSVTLDLPLEHDAGVVVHT